MSFTVGKLEDKLRKFPKGTPIYSECCNCHNSSNADLKIIDKSSGTYGYITLVLNDRKDPKIECSTDEKQWYEKEIERLNTMIKELESKVENYKCVTDRVESSLKWLDRM